MAALISQNIGLWYITLYTIALHGDEAMPKFNIMQVSNGKFYLIDGHYLNK